MTTAVLVDAAFFLKRFRVVYPNQDAQNPEVDGIKSICPKPTKP